MSPSTSTSTTADPHPESQPTRTASSKDKDASKKRSRYTSVACNECKRRKIKCNGEKPCERCGNQNLTCFYESPNFQDSEEYRRMCAEIETLQGQVRELFGLVAEMRAEREAGSARDARMVGEATKRGAEATGVAAAGVGARAGSRDGNGNGLGSGASRVLVPESEMRCLAAETVTDVEMGCAGSEKGVIDATSFGGDAVAAAAAAAGQARIEVDMSRHDGRIDFVHDEVTRVQDLAADPITSISLADLTNLMMVYTQQLHPIYPFLELSEVLAWLDRRGTLTTQLPCIEEWQEDIPPVSAMIGKMTLAVAAHAQDSKSQLAHQLYVNVQKIYSSHNAPPGYMTAPNGDMGSASVRPPWKSVIKGIRLRLLEGLWQFQHGNADAAIAAVREAMMVSKMLSLDVANDPDPDSEAAQTVLKISGSVYSMYWRWKILTQPAPRFDSDFEKIPPRRFEEGEEYEKDKEAPVRGAFFELAKLCSITCFAFERHRSELAALKATNPPWAKENAIEHVHRWQGGFAIGLRSLAAQRAEFLGKKSVDERITLSAVFLHAYHLRISVCWYKRADAADRYNGPISELYDSAKWAHESINVLWAVHEVGKTWMAHPFLYNSFLLAFGSWIYDLLNAGAIRLSDEVKVSLQKTLVLMETYCPYWERCSELLGKLQESRKYGAFS